jgi:hypothetical protein
MNKVYSKFALISGTIFTLLIFISFSEKYDSPNEETTVKDELPQVIKAIKFNKSYYFAGEEIPNDNFDAMERLDRELLVNSYWHSNTVQTMKLSGRYFPVMEKIMAEHGIPEDFKYLAVAESGLRNVSSPAAARGLWQFRKLAAKEFGMEVNDQVDERYHIEKATHAACKYLKQLHKRFGSWINAAAAYNVGPTKFARTLKEQGESSYFDLNINHETSRYIFRLTAIKAIFENPEAYGFYLDSQDKYHPLDDAIIVEVDKSVPSWAEFAKKHGITYRMLKVYNPWMRDSDLTVIKNKYEVKIPKS